MCVCVCDSKIKTQKQKRVLFRYQFASSADWAGLGRKDAAENRRSLEKSPPSAGDRRPKSGGHPGRSVGPEAAPPSCPGAPSQVQGSPGQDHIRGEVPSGGARRTLTPQGSPGGRAGAEAPSRGGGKPDLIGKERSKGRLICPPGSALAPSGRRAGLLRGLCPLGGRGKGGRGLPARPRDPARLAPALEGQTFAPGRSEGS